MTHSPYQLPIKILGGIDSEIIMSLDLANRQVGIAKLIFLFDIDYDNIKICLRLSKRIQFKDLSRKILSSLAELNSQLLIVPPDC